MSRVSQKRGPLANRASYIQPHLTNQGFVCIQCGQFVSCANVMSGVQNRNHCPVCLWSRHLDWRESGDRLSNCRAGMEPIGLTTKRSRNKYASEQDGELMLIHRCVECDVLVINRIAADDHHDTILEIFDRSMQLSTHLHERLAQEGIRLLNEEDQRLVQQRLFGGR